MDIPKVKEVMFTKVFSVNTETPFIEAAYIFEMHHRVNPILVINSGRALVGVLARSDIIKFYTSSTTAGASSKATDRDAGQFIKEFHSNIGQITRKFKIWFWAGASLFIIIILGAFLLFLNLLSSVIQNAR